MHPTEGPHSRQAKSRGPCLTNDQLGIQAGFGWPGMAGRRVCGGALSEETTGLQETVEIRVCRSVLVTGGVLSVIPLLALSRASPFRG